MRTDTRENPVGKNGVMTILQAFLTKCVTYAGHYMVLSKLHEFGLPSLALPSLSVISQLVPMIRLCSYVAHIMISPFSYYM